ncbi:MAG: ribose 5-phosphate isomerase B [Nitrospinae bacterium]|nr:ribose 5-phosphate isomerase B [Nitrospinota bacterium]
MGEQIAIASDHAGFRLKESVKTWLADRSYSVLDLGTHTEESCDYPDFAAALAQALAAGKAGRGILICGTGVGMSMAANKFPHIRAAVCHDPTTARLSREHNDANVLAMGGRITGEAVAFDILDVWLRTAFAEGRHSPRVAKINALSPPLKTSLFKGEGKGAGT